MQELAKAAGDSIRVGMVAGPNMAIVDHTVAGSDTLMAIARDPWSYVVLQQGPTPDGICRDTLVIAAMRLAPSIRAAGGRPVIFLPWTRRAYPQLLGIAGESATEAARAVGGMAAAAHRASEEFPPDPDDPVPADTTRISAGGGPC